MKRYSLVLLLTFLACGCAHAPAPLNDIPLVWAPTSTVAEIGAIDTTGMTDVKIQMGGFTDARKDTALIGANREDGQDRPVTTRDAVAGYVTDHLRETLQKTGLDVVDSGGTAVLSGEVKDFFVTEVNTYHAEITLSVTLRNAAGKTLWSGVVGGSSTTFGHSYSAANYYKVLSNALVDATHTLLANPGFHDALAAK
ncbi:MAG TPA: YajG family lipoprotein [Gammaproteobacteria bacterium]